MQEPTYFTATFTQKEIFRFIINLFINKTSILLNQNFNNLNFAFKKFESFR
jgi:hypothetical protein